MPNRILREGILTSERVNLLSPNAELFYRRLQSVVDDYGRFSANLSLLRASCYPLKLDSVKEDSISKHLAECVGARLIVLYTVADKAYLELQDFRQQVRAKVSKYPSPDGNVHSACVADDAHMIANAHLDGDGDEDEDGGEDERATPIAPDGGDNTPASTLVDTVVSAYHAALPNCQRVSVVTPKRKRRIELADKLARQACKRVGWEYDAETFWPAYWGECTNDPWMRGDVPNPKNPGWKQRLDVLLDEKRFADVMDRAIERVQVAA